MKRWDMVLYIAIALGTALAAAPDPLTWRSWVLILLATATTVKAKLSPGRDAAPNLPDSAGK